MNCGIIAVVMGTIFNIMGKFLSTAHKHNRQTFEHNNSDPSYDNSVVVCRHIQQAANGQTEEKINTMNMTNE